MMGAGPPPEIFSRGQQAGGRDVFAAGAFVLHLVGFRSPVVNCTPAGRLSKIVGHYDRKYWDVIWRAGMGGGG